jgi:hypothetical protein
LSVIPVDRLVQCWFLKVGRVIGMRVASELRDQVRMSIACRSAMVTSSSVALIAAFASGAR